MRRQSRDTDRQTQMSVPAQSPPDCHAHPTHPRDYRRSERDRRRPERDCSSPQGRSRSTWARTWALVRDCRCRSVAAVARSTGSTPSCARHRHGRAAAGGVGPSQPITLRSDRYIKAEAVAAGREIARGLRVEHTLPREDGPIVEKNSYGNDPFPPTDGRKGRAGSPYYITSMRTDAEMQRRKRMGACGGVRGDQRRGCRWPTRAPSGITAATRCSRTSTAGSPRSRYHPRRYSAATAASAQPSHRRGRRGAH